MTIGVKLVPPMPPSEEMVKLAPCMSAGESLPSRAFFEMRAQLLAQLDDALAVDVPDHRHDQAVRRVDGDAEMVVALVDQRVLLRATASC